MNESRMKSMIKEQVREVLKEMAQNRPDSKYTNWIPSDISYFEGKGFEYDDNDDSYSAFFLRETNLVHVQKRNNGYYAIKVIVYEGMKFDGIIFNATARDQDDLFRHVAQAIRVASGQR